VAAVLAVRCVCCGPCRLLCWGGVPCGGKHIIVKVEIYIDKCMHMHIYIHTYMYMYIDR